MTLLIGGTDPFTTRRASEWSGARPERHAGAGVVTGTSSDGEEGASRKATDHQAIREWPRSEGWYALLAAGNRPATIAMAGMRDADPQ